MTIGETIVRIRKKNKIKAIELAERVGITQGYLSEIENNKKNPAIDVLQRISNELSVTVADLLGETAMSLPEEQLQLLEQTKDLSPEQIKALITVAKVFNKDLSKHTEVHIDKKIDTPKLVTDSEHKYIAKAAHYEGDEGLNQEEQSAIQSEIDKIKEQYNPDGSPRNKK